MPTVCCNNGTFEQMLFLDHSLSCTSFQYLIFITSLYSLSNNNVEINIVWWKNWLKFYSNSKLQFNNILYLLLRSKMIINLYTISTYLRLIILLQKCQYIRNGKLIVDTLTETTMGRSLQKHLLLSMNVNACVYINTSVSVQI